MSELRVTTTHLIELASTQAKAASETRNATFAVEGIDVAVRSTHGAIASATAGAVEAVLATRCDAGTKMAAISDELGRRLAATAREYDRVDGELRDRLEGTTG